MRDPLVGDRNMGTLWWVMEPWRPLEVGPWGPYGEEHRDL